MFKFISTGICCIVAAVSLAGCSSFNQYFAENNQDAQVEKTKPLGTNNLAAHMEQDEANPASIAVLVNKQHKLPGGYEPNDLVYTKIPFIPTSAKAEKREMRSKAAAAVKNLFDGAKAQGVNLLGVSAYRSEKTQISLFNTYVNRDGYEKAKSYSALPGTSEHETGLAIDVTGGDGKCAASDCFGGSPEARWLKDHAADYGFIIRYPKGKESITGYQFEPWHIRYVGTELAKEIMSQGITLEEYYNAAKVNN